MLNSIKNRKHDLSLVVQINAFLINTNIDEGHQNKNGKRYIQHVQARQPNQLFNQQHISYLNYPSKDLFN